jgi:hypothetical protein
MDDSQIFLYGMVAVIAVSLIYAVVIFIQNRSLVQAVTKFTETNQNAVDKLYLSQPVVRRGVDALRPVVGLIDDAIPDEGELGLALAILRKYIDKIDGIPNVPSDEQPPVVG